MSMSHNGLAKLIEECGELIQVAGKLIAYPEGMHPDNNGNLRLRLADEIADVTAACAFVCDKFKPDKEELAFRRNRKYETYKNWDKK